MRTRMLLLLLTVPVLLQAQTVPAQAPPARTDSGWGHTLVAGLTLTQVSFTDWAQGGVNALAWTSTLDGRSTDDKLMTNWTTTYKFAFGQARLSGQGTRKTDDKIDLETILTYKLGTHVNPYGAATLKTQFARGYVYDATTGVATAVSQFWDPGYLTQSVGLGYQPAPQIKTRLGTALRETFTSNFPQYADDPKTLEIEKTRVEGGLESVTDLELKLEENVLFTARLELFSPFKTMDRIVLRNDNLLAAKVSKYITANLSLQLIQDPVISPRTQLKQTIAIGLSYTLI